MRQKLRTDASYLPAAKERRGTRSEQAYEYIKSLLLDGHFKPGELLQIDALAAQLKISRQPVMEAIRLLSVDELIEIMPQVGCRVIQPAAEDISDFYDVFSRIEGLAAELTAQRHDANDLRKLKHKSDEIGSLRQSDLNIADRASTYRMLNRDFHGLINEMARSASLARLARSFWDRGDFYLYSSSQHPVSNSISDVQEEHEAIIDAIATGNGDAARQIMEGHMLGFGRRLVANMRKAHKAL
jgi:DNA-binding GntR family transcriptional regulator